MITDFKIFEAKIKWYSKGKFFEEESDIDTEEFKKGDRIDLIDTECWNPDIQKFKDYIGSDREKEHTILNVITTEEASRLNYGRGLDKISDQNVFEIEGK
jgi:hypothetical protein